MKETDSNCDHHPTKQTGWLALGLWCLALISMPSVPLHAQLGAIKTSSPARFVVRDTQGLSSLKLTCFLLDCQVVEPIGDPNGQLFAIQTSGLLSAPAVLAQLLASNAIADVEPDQTGNTPPPPSDTMPWYAYDQLPTAYYGSTVWEGYVLQTPNQIVRASSAQSSFNVAGAGASCSGISCQTSIQ